jgi:hypothetical protein
MFARQRQDPKFTKSDLKKAATFISTPDAQYLKVVIKPMESKADPTGKREVSVPDSSVRVEFKSCRFRTFSSAIMMAMLKHRAFGKSTKGFSIDPKDPTGLWRELDVIKVKEVKTVVSVPTPGSEDLENLSRQKVCAAAAKLDKKTSEVDEKTGAPVFVVDELHVLGG